MGRGRGLHRRGPRHRGGRGIDSVSHPSERELIYDWNVGDSAPQRPPRRVQVVDETLRDGLQSPSVADPAIADKIRALHLQARIGVHGNDIGLPGAGPRARDAALALAKEIVSAKLAIEPYCAARTLKADIDPIIEITQKTGLRIEAATFIGSSPIRQYAEDWDLERMLRHTEEAVTYSVRNGVPVMYVTEDTTRARPEILRKLYTTAIECGARRVCVSDTVGHATPDGAARVIRFMREVVDGTERVGNAPHDLILVNLKLLGWLESDLTALPEYCELVSRACRVPIPYNYPALGRDAFRTATGVHAAAVIKARKKGDAWLADRVYSSVPADWLGLKQQIDVGPMCGESNVICWLIEHGEEPDPKLVGHIFQLAKQRETVFEDGELSEIVRAFKKPKAGTARVG
ncbi:MAG: 2-isopropylmalate synthase [Candidatus Eisenbacteria bacterium]|uniref:2-isopropylmalate synthase n=1 Tax=Eiseniibacteriota bacterium TaxID=2212470 RepID=A0A538TRG9_UNCEI|nr:MAG: 2-isopropylmalate synthase [Candidatus Eisenbacteria bacterium]